MGRHQQLNSKVDSVTQKNGKQTRMNKTRKRSQTGIIYDESMKEEKRKILQNAARRFFLSNPGNGRNTPRAFRDTPFHGSVSKLSLEHTENHERQWHGKILELRVIILICREIAQALLQLENNTPITKYSVLDKTRQIFEIYNSSHTASMDIDFYEHFGDIQIPDTIIQKYGNGISVKHTKYKTSINMGDLLSQYNHFEHNWTLIVGFYEQKSGVKIPIKDQIYCFHFKPEHRDFFFGTCEKEELIHYKNSVSKALSKSDARQFAKSKPTVKNIIINPKINSEQQRVQCSINQTQFYKLINDFNIKHHIFKTSQYKFLYNPMKNQKLMNTIVEASSSPMIEL